LPVGSRSNLISDRVQEEILHQIASADGPQPPLTFYVEAVEKVLQA